jgi:outer membrane protein insertion porin family
VVLAGRLENSTIFQFDETSLPATEKLFTGGTSSVRGFKDGSLGPVQIQDNVSVSVGGKFLLLGNIELRFFPWWKLISVLFFDTGNVWEDVEHFRFTELKTTLGIGIGIATPVGPLRLDYGFKLLGGELFRLDKSKKIIEPGSLHIGLQYAF